LFLEIRRRDLLAAHCAQVVPVRPHRTNFFRYTGSRHDTVVLLLKHVRLQGRKRVEMRIESVFAT